MKDGVLHLDIFKLVLFFIRVGAIGPAEAYGIGSVCSKRHIA
jgi:hypothetical protein